MLRINVFSATAFALLAGASGASAADVITYDPAPAAPVYSPTAAANWTGPYVGLTGGYGWGGGSIGHDGLLGGAYAGYNFQIAPNVVVGLEGDVIATGKSGSSGGTSVSNPWNATVRGRLGYSMDRYLIYGTGGVAFGGVKATGGPTESSTETGWTAGAGIEALLTEKVTGRVEFRHTDLGTTAGSLSYHSNDIMVGVGIGF